jgi:hypothetical protein
LENTTFQHCIEIRHSFFAAKGKIRQLIVWDEMSVSYLDYVTFMARERKLTAVPNDQTLLINSCYKFICAINYYFLFINVKWAVCQLYMTRGRLQTINNVDGSLQGKFPYLSITNMYSYSCDDINFHPWAHLVANF